VLPDEITAAAVAIIPLIRLSDHLQVGHIATGAYVVRKQSSAVACVKQKACNLLMATLRRMLGSLPFFSSTPQIHMDCKNSQKMAQSGSPKALKLK
jgi:hypothetical protein